MTTGKILAALFFVGVVSAASIPSVRLKISEIVSSGPVDLNTRFILRPAEKGPFRILITENGTVDSLRNATLTSRIEGSTTIIRLVPEGSKVREPVVAEFDGVLEYVDVSSKSQKTVKLVGTDGTSKTFEVSMGEFTELLIKDRDPVRKGDFIAGDVVCELDASVLIEKEKEQQIKLTAARASLEKATKNIQIQETTNESNLAKAKLAEKLADLDLEKYEAEGGEYEQLMGTVNGEIKKYQEEVAMFQEDYERVREQARRGYANLNVLEAARIKVNQSKNLLTVKQGERGVLERFTKERTVSELRQLAEDTKRETLRAGLEGEAALALLKADFDAAKLTEGVETEKLELLRRQIRASRLVASQAGEVVYASQKSSRSEPVVIEEGASVRERQAIINLPDLEMMKIDARIHESKISRVSVGQPVEIEVDALPGETYRGVLQTVSSVPMPGSWPNTDLKEYEASIEIKEDSAKVRKLKPGMNAEVRIIVEDRAEDVLQVPVQAIVSFSGQYFAYVAADKAPERREIKVGDANDEYMEILDGIKAGDRVVMSPRTYFSRELSELESRLSDQVEANRERVVVPKGAGTSDSGRPPGGERSGGERSGGGREGGGRDGRAASGASGNGPPGNAGGGAPGGRDPKAMFESQDANKDGVITKDEARRPEFFERMDADKNGKVTLEELQEAMKSFQR
ncbi:MAG: efflux RND transporter periplasmic adaptor subunit [Planctomyces sp.]